MKIYCCLLTNGWLIKSGSCEEYFNKNGEEEPSLTYKDEHLYIRRPINEEVPKLHDFKINEISIPVHSVVCWWSEGRQTKHKEAGKDKCNQT